MRRASGLTAAVTAGLSGETPREMFLALAETEAEGNALYDLAQARRQAYHEQ